MFNSLLSERMRQLVGLAPAANAFAGTVNSRPVNLGLAEQAQYQIVRGAGSTGTATITVQTSAANDGLNPVAIPFRYRTCNADGTNLSSVLEAPATGFVFTAGANRIAMIEVRTTDLTDHSRPFTFVRSVEGTVGAYAGSIMTTLYGLRYPGVGSPDAI